MEKGEGYLIGYEALFLIVNIKIFWNKNFKNIIIIIIEKKGGGRVRIYI